MSDAMQFLSSMGLYSLSLKCKGATFNDFKGIKYS